MNRKAEKRRRLYLWLFLGWAAAIIVVSVIPLSRDLKDIYENRFVRGDYLMHFLIFLLGYLIYRVNAREYGKHEASSSLPGALLIVMLILALLAEAVQLVIPSRTFNLYDVMANYTGIVFGMAATIILRPFDCSRRHRRAIAHDTLEKT